MNLCIDIGNTRTKLGYFLEGQLIKKLVLKQLTPTHLTDLPYNQKVQACILSFTGNVPDGLRIALSERYYFLELDYRTPIPIINKYETPTTLGRDRLAGVIAASAIYPNQCTLVVDAGTCITYDFISHDKIYAGGNIAPGLRMRLQAMHDYTTRLPFIEKAVDNPAVFFGTNTETALRRGAQVGIFLEIEGYIGRLEEKYGKIKTILTGGDASFLVKHIKREIFARPNLILYGLNQILEHNVEQLS